MGSEGKYNTILDLEVLPGLLRGDQQARGLLVLVHKQKVLHRGCENTLDDILSPGRGGEDSSEEVTFGTVVQQE